MCDCVFSLCNFAKSIAKSAISFVLSGKCQLNHQNACSKQFWQDLPRKDAYQSIDSPGSIITNNEILYDDSIANSGFDNFAVAKIVVDEFELLKLRSDGNQRKLFKFDGHNWQNFSLVP